MKKPTIHLICNAHLDPVWQWRWEEGCAEAISTFECAVRMLAAHPGLIFNHNEAVLYDWVRTYDAPLFKEIKRLVKLGRWHISGGWYLQPDVNLPGIESIIRHIAQGRAFFKEQFKAEPTVAYNFDSFGHGGGLPQVLKQCGYGMYIHMRPQESELHLPSDLYWWKGVDGSSILTYRIAVGLYHTERDNIKERIESGIDLALQLRRDVPVFWGIGNHGGGATLEDLEVIDRIMRDERRVKIRHSTPELLYAALRPYAAQAPVIEGDIQRVFTGCYTSLSRLKRGALESLGTITQTEAACASAWIEKKLPYPARELDEIWRDHLFNDFHDILPGSCTEPAESDALDLYGRASESSRRLRLRAINRFAHGAKKRFYVPVTVFNSNPSLTHVPLEAECMLDLRPKWTGSWHLRVYDMEGRELPSQQEQPESLLPFNGWRRKLAFNAALPGVGLTYYEIRIHEGDRTVEPARPMLDHTYDEREGLIRSVKTSEGVECLAGGMMKGLIVEDLGDSWGADCSSYRTIVGQMAHRSESNAMLSDGPVRSIRESVFEHGHSRMVVRTIAYAQLPMIEYRIRVTWNETRKRLKLSIPTVFHHSDSILCEIPGGVIRRPADGQEHVHSRWCVIGKAEAALGLVNNGQHGIDVMDGEIRLSVLRSAAYCHEKGFALGDVPARKYMDQGVHEIRLIVTAGMFDQVIERLPALADWITVPPAVYAHLPIEQTEPVNMCSIEPKTIRLLALTQSRDHKALIIRLQETIGRGVKARVAFHTAGGKKTVNFAPFEIKTFRLGSDGTLRACPMIEEG